MRMWRELVIPPAVEPVTVEEAKAELRVDHNAEDALIARLIVVGRQSIEQDLQRALITQRWRFTLEPPRDGSPIRLPLPPTQSVVSVTYRDPNGAVQAMDLDDVVLEAPSGPAAFPAELRLRPGATWPDRWRSDERIAIEVDAGYGDPADVPAVLVQGVLAAVVRLYESRGSSAASVPAITSTLLQPYRVTWWLT